MCHTQKNRLQSEVNAVASSNALNVNVNVTVTATDQTADQCMRVLEIWLTSNPGWTIVGNLGEDGKITLERVRLSGTTAEANRQGQL